MSNSASSSPIDGVARPNALTQALQQSRSNQSSPVTGQTTVVGGSRFADSPRSLHGSISSSSAAGGTSRASPTTMGSNTATPTRYQQAIHQPGRAASSSTATVTMAGVSRDSPPGSSAGLNMDKRRHAGAAKGDDAHAFRTSSMDSTISSMSSVTNQSGVSSDAGPSPAELAALIASAGGAESLIRQLLREKRTAAAQNNQLFKLLNKQKSMMQGMHVDLERALADKEKYRNLAATLHVPITPEAHGQYRKLSPAVSNSSLPSTTSMDAASNTKPHTPHKLSTSDLKSQAQSAAGFHQPDSAVSNESASPTTFLAGEDKRNTITQAQVAKPAPLQPKREKKEPSNAMSPRTPPRTPKSPDLQSDSTRASFTARRSATQRKENAQFSSNPSSPTENIATSPSARKAPPAPLVLAKSPESVQTAKSTTTDQLGSEDHTDSDYDDLSEDELPTFERGRKKTREEDDLEREVIMIRAHRASQSAQKSKSHSKGSKASQKTPATDDIPQTPSFKGFSPPASATSAPKSAQSASIASVLGSQNSGGQGASNSPRHLISPSLKSPGLPLSPRPQDRPSNAAGPRASQNIASATFSQSSEIHDLLPNPPPARQPPPTGPLPQPPMSAPLQYRNAPVRQNDATPQSAALQAPPLRPAEASDLATEAHSGTIYHGFISEAYPDLLLPPNALPSVQVRVTSSRLRPARQTSQSARNSGDESVFTLGVFARSNHKQLWRVEKAAVSLVSLEHQLKQIQPVDVKIPDRSLFSGHAPARVDARRAALENFFETLLDTHMTEKAAVILCKYFSTQVIPSEDHHHQHGKSSDGSIPESIEKETVVKEGYLTKKGKNFGGWKARYFVLNEPILRYYESPTGSLLGTIKLTNAQIGRQSAQKSRSPARTEPDDADSQYRHAFLIMEPKRNNSNSQLQHVLCAESDIERDEWVEALMFYLGKEPESKSDHQRAKSTPRTEPTRENKSIFQNMMKEKKERQSDASENPPDEQLRGVSYNDTMAGQAPTMVSTRNAAPRNAHTPPPPTPATAPLVQSSPAHGGKAISGPKHAAPIEDAAAWGNKNRAPAGISAPTNGSVITDASVWGNKDIISGPKNGAPIQNASQWGNKSLQADRRPPEELKPPTSPRITDKEGRKRSFWGFRGHGSHDSNASASETTAAISKVNTRAVFGAPLAEAVEFGMAVQSPTPLPAVVYRCLEYLEARGAEMEEGIFRISGSTLTINKLKERFNTEGDVNLLNDGTYFDVHAVASLLKLYLRELPERVLTNTLYPQFAAVQELPTDAAKVKAYNALVHKLPLPNWTLIHSLCRFLIQVDAASELSKMTVRNLCIVFVPTLNLSNPIMAYFLKDFHDIFDREPEGASSVSGPDGVGIKVTAASPRNAEHLDNRKDSPESGLGIQYEDVLQLAHGLNGDDSSSQTSVSTRVTTASSSGGATHGGPEYGPVRVAARTGPGLGAAAGGPKDMKQKRRESNMLMMSFPAPGGNNPGPHGQYPGEVSQMNTNGSLLGHRDLLNGPQRKSSLPLMREEFE